MKTAVILLLLFSALAALPRLFEVIRARRARVKKMPDWFEALDDVGQLLFLEKQIKIIYARNAALKAKHSLSKKVDKPVDQVTKKEYTMADVTGTFDPKTKKAEW